jgi:hypothetical protein
MPVRLSTSLLSVDAAKIHKVGECPESLGEGDFN